MKTGGFNPDEPVGLAQSLVISSKRKRSWTECRCVLYFKIDARMERGRNGKKLIPSTTPPLPLLFWILQKNMGSHIVLLSLQEER